MAKKAKSKKHEDQAESVVKKEPTEEEKARLEEHRQRAKNKPIKFKKTEDKAGNWALAVEDENDRPGHAGRPELRRPTMQRQLRDQDAQDVPGAGGGTKALPYRRPAEDGCGACPRERRRQSRSGDRQYGGWEKSAKP